MMNISKLALFRNFKSAIYNFKYLGVCPGNLLLCFLLFTSFELSLSAQEDVNLYRGVWEMETPDNGTLVLIVKRNELASYFWLENPDLTVYQGSWSSDTDGVVLKWQDGSTHRIYRDDSGYKSTYSDDMHVERYTAQARRLPEELLGQWAKSPSRQDDQVSDRDRARGFFGNWKIGSGDDVYYVLIEEDRSAASNWTQDGFDPNGLRGSWAKQGSELHVVWDSGHYGILRQNEREYTFKLIAPGTVIENDQSKESTAIRTDSETVPQEWYASYTAEQEANTGRITFVYYNNIQSFYRGTWLVQRTPEAFEQMELGWFGGLKTSIDQTLQGNWRMNRLDVFMRWDDGLRKILSPVGQGFLLYEYKPGRPLDGVPMRIFPATPQNAKKLAMYTAGQRTAADQLLQLAKANGMTSSSGEGRGKSFARWILPFDGSNKVPSSTESLLQSSTGSSHRPDPWWWPFWSEAPDDLIVTESADPTVKESESSSETIPGKADSELKKTATNRQNDPQIKNETEAPNTANTAKAAKAAKADWEWPF